MKKTQKSFDGQSEMGILYLVPTPIGNLEDMTFRAIQTLKDVDYIAAEDTRQTKKLCHVYEIDTPLTSYHEHNKDSSGHKLIEWLKEGKNIALVSDAGLPTISDPGAEVVRDFTNIGGYVIPLPGANAALTALIASGIAPQPFFFYGFLDRQKKEKKKQLEALKKRQETIVFYEAPHRLKETLTVMKEVWGNRNIAITRELTKKFEEFIRGDLEYALTWVTEQQIRGEFCLVVQGNDQDEEELNEEAWWNSLSEKEHVIHYIEEGLTSKEAIKRTAVERGVPKRTIYDAYHIEQ
ncbi:MULTISPECIES: 16S rRNA (cytidine(1402)-2'-O)-methyltransferase [Bacillus]|jgi:16S rRNA (cytidine1402-2'-O)-methyltransferase|uniref:Ribosomal RNA small subunit methyltransferase I n=1 Tax=Bacillus altitudinis TaxID=293387 RepID=A0A653YKY5_BACAB|nr:MULTISPECIES: 16S rRNA (cytidine(1402)-2'-O)-methyltransferase [Bacillus]MBY0187559.1 16S rRNA (cytidine(1402)-2'-O)-methyltransferase [Bacillus aerophilus]KLV18151.1 16S rRNA methyltransferase [Bacillus altitudinis]KQU13739.1 16S rRNA methyltransferase [Bacillus sp. Leaf49]KWZ67012.1 16S rRNA methyltransferase [Bacillus altitudinis]MBR0580678.1 16S rRNA (cytidine(1402)-2'-O)-methyltransferase [Bacillus altitudinis A23-8]